MPEINKVFKREVWRLQVAHLHIAARASPIFQILSVCTLIDDKNEPISERESGQTESVLVYKMVDYPRATSWL